MKSLWLTALLFALSLPLYAQQSTRRDGNWWLEQTPLLKASYITGFFDGTDLGSKFSYWECHDEDVSKACLVNSKARESYEFYGNKYTKDVTNIQLADGLDVFYKDYRNRKIRVSDGVWLTLNAIAGRPQADLDKMVQNFRKNAD
ncbi:MAG: hypothetical protein WB799_24235 [Candidatus Sulfotelmatobacter sp.]